MFRIAPRSGRPVARPRARLSLEALGPRLAPNAAPQITGLTVSPAGSGGYVLTGRVIDEQPYGLTVELCSTSDAVQGQRAEVNEDGTFVFLIGLDDDSGPVTVSATTEDWEGLFSDPAVVLIASA